MEINFNTNFSTNTNLNTNSANPNSGSEYSVNGFKKIDSNEDSKECETCKNRKYVDGSDEMVSFKSAAHIAPEAAATRVRSHEQEHVSNAYKDAAQNNGKVLSASVRIKTDVCPECGRSYIAGGETATQIKYYNEETPYQKALKVQESSKYAGMNVDSKC